MAEEQKGHRIEIALDVVGCGSVKVDGVELADATSGIDLWTRAGDGTYVTLRLAPRYDLFLTAEEATVLKRLPDAPDA